MVDGLKGGVKDVNCLSNEYIKNKNKNRND